MIGLGILKSSIICVFSYNYAKIKIDLDEDLPLEDTLNLHNVKILTKEVYDKD